ncbi:uncharacterized protein LOC100370756 [Saccoglossus kowalevskii]|uniref:Uncharacterized protein LOC100370756 n=1 Tax=Saccoglossus kowalevskii TaxID=10224 RepID=A0ABM0GPI8_SACKO|nr:PREDICTED: uncharacterized protein LOC100370756 [Saccoglossus kowalevskii]
MKLLILIVAIGAAFAGPVPSSKSCNQRFEEGQKYFYQYEADTMSGVVGTSERRSGMRIICEVEVEVPDKYQLSVNTPKCELLEQNPDSEDPYSFRVAQNSREFSREMSRNSLVVEVNQGRINRIQPHVEEPVHILNIKRGIVSSLQLPNDEDLKNDRFQATKDVHGNCTAEAQILEMSRRNDNIRRVKLDKDLSNCSRSNKTYSRESPLSLLRNISAIEKMVNSTQNCTYTMSSACYIKEVKCQESHTFTPLSYNNSGVQTNISQVMTRTRSPEKLNRFARKQDSSRVYSEIAYEFEVEPEPTNTTMNTTLEVLFNLVNKTVNETSIDAPRLFNNLVASLRALDNQTIHNLLPVAWNCSQYGNCSNNREQELSRSYMIDALPQCGTWPCMSVIASALINSTINGSRADVLLYALAFEPNPSLQVINETLRIASAIRSRPAILTLSTLINNYYQNNETAQKQKELPEPVRKSIHLMREIIGDDCNKVSNDIQYDEAENNRQVLLALKGIGNIGRPVQIEDKREWYRQSTIVAILMRCAKNQAVPRNVTIAAVQALRRMESTDELRDDLMSLVRDHSNDVEVRLAAYIILMKNPSRNNLREVVSILKNEPINQMRSFISSHIANIRESEEPTLKDLKKELEFVLVGQQLPEMEQDLQKLSRHMEFSKAFKVPFVNQTVAAQLESNLIYSPEGILPRSLMLNMTVNILGKSVNVFETGFDAEGLEPLLEGLFGPQGYFPNLNLIALFNNMTGNLDYLNPRQEPVKNNAYSKFNSKIQKSKNAVEEPRFLANKIHKALEDLHDDVSHKQLSPSVSAYIKVLGNELGFANLDDIKNLMPNISVSDLPSMSAIMKLLADGIDYNVTRSYMFLEANHVIPTGMGLPLNVSVNGTTVVALRIAGKFDMRKYLQQDVVASGLVSPSAAVEIVGRFGVNVPLFGESGVQLNATMYHNSQLEGNVTLKGSELRFNVNKTLKPINLVNISAEQYLVRGARIERLEGIKENRTEWSNCTSSLLNTTALFGLDLCTSLSYSNASNVTAPRFPLTGPTSFNLTVNPTDKNLTTYTVLMKYEQIKKPIGAQKQPSRKVFKLRKEKPIVEIIDVFTINFTAPGQNLTRNVSSQLTINRNKTEAVWNFTIPELKNISIAAGVQNISEPERNVTNFVASFNATYGSKNFSNSLRVRNETLNLTRVENGREIIIPVNNYSMAWNISLNDLFFCVQSDVVNKTGNWSSSFNVTYYWDDQTPMMDQLRPEYVIKPENYSKFEVLFEHVNKSLSNETLLESRLNFTFGRQNISLILSRWNNTQNATKAMNVSWVNSGELRTMNVTYEYKNRSSPVVESIQRVWNMSLPEWHMALVNEVVNTSREFNTSMNFTIYSQNKTLKEEYKRYDEHVRNKLIEYYGVEAYKVVPDWYNASMTFSIRNETVPSSRPYAEVIATSFNVSVMNPFNKTSIHNFTMVGKLVNDSAINNANFSYWANVNVSLPFVSSNVSMNMSVLNNTNGVAVSYNVSGLSSNISSVLNYTHSSMNMSLVFNLTSPVYNYTSNHTIYNSTESGMVYLYNCSGSTNYTLPIQNFTLPEIDRLLELIPQQVFNWTDQLRNVSARLNVTLPYNLTIPSIVGNISLPFFNISVPLNRTLQLLNHTFSSNITIRPENISISVNASHPFFVLNVTQEIIKDGPLVNMSLSKMLNSTVGELWRIANTTTNKTMSAWNKTMSLVKGYNMTNLNLTGVKKNLDWYKQRVESYLSPMNISFLNEKIWKPIRQMNAPELKALREPLREISRELPKMVDELTPDVVKDWVYYGKDMVYAYTPSWQNLTSWNLTSWNLTSWQNITSLNMSDFWSVTNSSLSVIKNKEIRESVQRMVNATVNSTLAGWAPVSEVIYQVLNSSMNATTFVNFTSQYFGNITVNHTMQLNSSQMNHTLYMNMTSKPANLTVNGTFLIAYNSSLEPNSTLVNSTLFVNMSGPIANLTLNNTFYFSSNSSLEPNSTVMNHTLFTNLTSWWANMTLNHTIYLSSNCSLEPNSTVLNHTLYTNLTSILANFTANHTLYISSNSSLEPNSTVMNQTLFANLTSWWANMTLNNTFYFSSNCSLEPNSTVMNHTLSSNLTSWWANMTFNHTLYFSSNSSLEPNSTVLNHTLSSNLTSWWANMTFNHTLYVSSNCSLEPNSTVLNHTLYTNMTSWIANLTLNHTLYISSNCSLEPNSSVMNHTLSANLTSPWVNGSMNHTLYVSSNSSLEPNSSVIKHWFLGNFSCSWVNASVNHTLYISSNSSLEPNSTVMNHTLQANVTSWLANVTIDHDLRLSSNSSLVPNTTVFNHTLFINFTCPIANVTLNATIEALNLTVYNQTIFVNFTGPLLNISVNQTIRNESFSVNVTAPGYGCLSLVGQLKNDSVLNVSVIHQNSSHPHINVTDLNLFISLNRSDVIYANLTWHPRILNHTLSFLNTSISMANTTINRTIDLFVKPAVNEILNVSMNYTMRVWEVVKNITHNETSLINQIIREFTPLNCTVFELVNYTVSNFTQIANRTINMTIEFAKNLTRETPLVNWTNFAINVTNNFTGSVQEVYNISMAYLNNTLPGWMYRYYEVDRQLNQLSNLSQYEQMVLQVWNETEKVVPQVARYVANKALDKIVVFGNNSVAVNISHNLNVTSLKSLPSLTNNQWEVLKTQYNLIKTMLKRVPYMSRHLRLPSVDPFVQSAMLFGAGHVYTFDGRYYEVPRYENRECTYVLARDFVDRNFTLLSTEDSITLITRDVAVEIDAENIVKINGNPSATELPYQTENKNVTVMRNGDWVNVTTVYGISLLCDSKNLNCLVNISGWYHNKTLGLFGTNDNEANNDWRKRDGSNATNVVDFINSFEVSGLRSCKKNPSRYVNTIGRDEASCNSPVSPMCDILFKSKQSPFEPCFSKVNPEPFRQACLVDSPKCDARQVRGICYSTAAYVAICNAKGVKVNDTNECETCEDNNRQRSQNEAWIEDNKLTADVVFVVSESSKMSNSRKDQLEILVREIESELKRSGINDNRYALVGFGGKGIHAPGHQHTINGKLYNSDKLFYSGAKALEFQGEYATDAFEAVKIAAELPFRPQATRLVFLVTESERSAVNVSLTIDDIQSILDKHAVILNVLAEYDELSKNGVYGVNFRGDYITGKYDDIKKGSLKLRSRIGESYAKLSSTTRGSLYSLEKVEHYDFLNKIPEDVARQVKSEVRNAKKVCECVRNAYGRAVTECRSMRT